MNFITPRASEQDEEKHILSSDWIKSREKHSRIFVTAFYVCASFSMRLQHIDRASKKCVRQHTSSKFLSLLFLFYSSFFIPSSFQQIYLCWFFMCCRIEFPNASENTFSSLLRTFRRLMIRTRISVGCTILISMVLPIRSWDWKDLNEIGRICSERLRFQKTNWCWWIQCVCAAFSMCFSNSIDWHVVLGNSLYQFSRFHLWIVQHIHHG